MLKNLFTLTAAALLFSGCASYKLGSNVPENCREIAVPIFENASGLPEVGSFATQAILAEMLRDGTFTPCGLDSAKVKLLGKVTRAEWIPIRYDRNVALQTSEYRLELTAEITLVEKSTGKLLLDRVPVTADTTFLSRNDLQTGMHDAMPRASAQLAKTVVAMLNNAW